MTEYTTAYIGLGSNLGDRNHYIQTALKMLSETKGIEVARVSDIIETSSLGDRAGPKYLNAAAEMKTDLSAGQLHRAVLAIEKTLGRERPKKWAPRTIDLDILLYSDQVISTSSLVVPHPEMHLRTFVLCGLCQLAPQLVHPVLNKPMCELLNRLNGGNFQIDPLLPQLVSVAGVIGVGKTTLTENLAKIFNCKTLLEPYATNPFLPLVYAGKNEFALDSEMYFLSERVEQLSSKALQAGGIYISDYILEKSRIYAKHWLDSQRLTLYEKIYFPLVSNVIKPSLVLYLRDSAENCLERIHNRNRPYEQKIQPQFLQALDADYEKLFAEWKTCPVIRLSIPEFDCRKGEDVENLANHIKYYIAV
jgi:deoxyguanosine kinase